MLLQVPIVDNTSLSNTPLIKMAAILTFFVFIRIGPRSLGQGKEKYSFEFLAQDLSNKGSLK